MGWCSVYHNYGEEPTPFSQYAGHDADPQRFPRAADDLGALMQTADHQRVEVRYAEATPDPERADQ